MATRGVKGSTQMCFVSIDLQDYLLPLTKGLALVDLMQHAVRCDARYSGEGLRKTVWKSTVRPPVGLEVVSADQIKDKPLSEREEDF